MRAFPADCPLVCWLFTADQRVDEYQTVFEEFPAYGSVLLRLALFRETLGPFVIVTRLTRGGRGHFCRALHVAVQTGLSHPIAGSGVQSLRISRWTSAIFPADCLHSDIVTATSAVAGDTQVSQHTARFFNVTTTVNFIVTAAVYRGFSSELCLAADPSL